MQLSEHFSLEEMTQSQTASRLGLDNTPSDQVTDNLRATCEKFEAVRDLLGLPITVTSGYRSPAVNKAVGGVGTSAHCEGWAVDFICPAFGSPYQIAEKIMASGLRFDQLIMEHTWVHIAFAPAMRQQPLTLVAGGGYKPGIHET